GSSVSPTFRDDSIIRQKKHSHFNFLEVLCFFIGRTFSVASLLPASSVLCGSSLAFDWVLA
ncbi:hypothetical protein, partial [Paenibacillus caseinilyticus]